MIRCWPSVAKLYEPHEICENKVRFVNVKSKYCIDEDFTVNYSLQEQFKCSTRDWIGIFPRNWINLQQYLTFEYTLSSPPNTENPQNRTITFPRIFHREALLTLDYQLVYISKEIQIMAISSFFRFTPSIISNEIPRCPAIESHGAIQNVDSMINICGDENSASSLQNENGTPLRKMENNKNTTNGLRPTCQYCHRQICGLKIDALRGDFLASFSDSLLDRVRRLERDLSLAEINLKNAKNSRDNMKKRLQAYEDFVAGMLSSVDGRGAVQFTDEKGHKIVLRRVNGEKSSKFEDEGKNEALEKEITLLKNIIEKQQKTVDDLIEQRNSYAASSRDRVKVVDREIQTNSLPMPIAVPLQTPNVANEKVDSNNERILAIAENPTIKENSIIPSIGVINEYDASRFSVDGKDVSSERLMPPRILKIRKPSGILVQGKNVKFAIVRL